MNSCRWLFRPARSDFISRMIDQEVGIFPEVNSLLYAVSSARDNDLEALPLFFVCFRHLRTRAAMALKAVVIFLLVTHIVYYNSPNDLGSELTILINNDLLGKSRSTHFWFNLTLFVNRLRKPFCRFRNHPPVSPIWKCCRQRLCDIGRAIVVTRAEYFKHTGQS